MGLAKKACGLMGLAKKSGGLMGLDKSARGAYGPLLAVSFPHNKLSTP
jgi:hypothetical protein